MYYKYIRKLQATFVGHILTRKGLEHLVITGKMEGRRGIGRQREQMIDSLAACMDIDKTASAISAAKDRAVWKDLIAHALGQGTQKEEVPNYNQIDKKECVCERVRL